MWNILASAAQSSSKTETRENMSLTNNSLNTENQKLQARTRNLQDIILDGNDTRPA